ncbi:unnamed protein product [Boreogadus saida]
MTAGVLSPSLLLCERECVCVCPCLVVNRTNCNQLIGVAAALLADIVSPRYSASLLLHAALFTSRALLRLGPHAYCRLSLRRTPHRVALPRVLIQCLLTGVSPPSVCA